MENLKNYNTEIIGSLDSVLNTTSIILYNRDKFSTKISVYNIDNFYENLINSGNYLELTRESVDLDFNYISGRLVDGFNVIIFIDPSTNFPSGYCDFVNTQGKELDLRIHIAYDGTTILGDTPLELSNSILVALESVVTSKSIVGDLPYEFTSREKVINSGTENLYTDCALRISSEPTSVISMGFGVVSRGIFNSLKLQNNILITPYPEYYRSLDSYSVTYYMNEIVAYGWSSDNDIYSIVCLSKTNRYGSPLYYTPSTPGRNIRVLPKYPGEDEVDISYVAGKFIYTVTGHIYDVYEEKYLEEDENRFTDPYDPNSKLQRFPIFKTKDEAYLEFPELSESYLNLSEYLRSYRGIIVRKIGKWIIFKQGDTGLYLAASPTTILYMTSEDLREALFINDQSVLLPGIDKTYYTLYDTAFRTYYTERARVISEKGVMINYYDHWLNSDGYFESLGYEDENYLGICSSSVVSRNREYDKYYQDEEIKVIRKNYELYDTPLNGYRHRAYNLESQGIPDFCCAFGGLLFWVSDFKINYL